MKTELTIPMRDIKVGDIIPIFGEFSKRNAVIEISGSTLYTTHASFLITDDPIRVMRIENDRLIIISGVDTYGATFSYEMYFTSTEMKDSEALHQMLVEHDPGDTYTVTFENMD